MPRSGSGSATAGVTPQAQAHAHQHEHFNLSVELSNPNAVYVSGCALQGKVVLRVKRHGLAFGGVVLRFLGEGFVQYVTMSFSAKARHEKLCTLALALGTELLPASSGDGSATVELIEDSLHEFAFELQLPAGLPSTFDEGLGIGRNRYYLLAHLAGHDSREHHSHHNHHVCRKEITVLALAKLSDELACPLSRFSIDDDDSPLTLELTVDRHGYMPGDLVRFAARIAHREVRKKKKKRSSVGGGSTSGDATAAAGGGGGGDIAAAGSGGSAAASGSGAAGSGSVAAGSGGGGAAGSGGSGAAVLRKAVLFVLQHVSFHASGRHSEGRVKTRLLAAAERSCDVRSGEVLAWDGELQLPDPLQPSTTPLQDHRIGFRYEAVLVGALRGAVTDTMALYDEARYHFEGERFRDSAIRDFLPHACAEFSVGSMDGRGVLPPSVRGREMVASLSDHGGLRKRKTSCIG